jgi:protein-disulfide isomerase
MLRCVLVCLFCSSILFSQKVETGAFPAWKKGAENAKFVIEVFNDYQCPRCASFNKELKEIENKFPNDLQIIFRQFPLKIPQHDKAILIAQATEAAGIQGKFWEMSDLVFEQQEDLRNSKFVKKTLVEYAKKLGLNTRKFKKYLQGNTVKKRVQLDIKRGNSLKVNFTPCVLFDGKIQYALDLEAILKERLNK